MPSQTTEERIVAAISLTAGVSIREAAKHLINAKALLDKLDLSTEWLAGMYQLLADLAHELDPAITPYPEVH